MKFLLLLLFLLLPLVLTGCVPAEPVPTAAETETTVVREEPAPSVPQEPTVPAQEPDQLELLLQSMSLEERVGQLFLPRCIAEVAREDVEKYHLGGFVLFGVDFENQTPESMAQTIASYQAASGIPLLIAVDEEGGTVTRVSRYPQYRSTPFPSPRSLYDRGGLEAVLTTESEKCRLLQSLGINVNLAPVCDITTQPGALLYDRSLGRSSEVTADCISRMVVRMSAQHVGSVLKHFPGYGNNADTHVGIAVDSRSLEELESRDLIPFAGGIRAGADAIMVSHVIVQCLDPEYPASLSPAVHQYLRQEMGFQGIILTDDLVMDAITNQYGAGEAAVLAVLAGNDILCCTEYDVQYAAVLEAVQSGRIDYYALSESVLRILRWKQELGLL